MKHIVMLSRQRKEAALAAAPASLWDAVAQALPESLQGLGPLGPLGPAL